METPSSNEITQLLVAWGNGDEDALNKLIPLVYQELHRLAGHYMRKGKCRSHSSNDCVSERSLLQAH